MLTALLHPSKKFDEVSSHIIGRAKEKILKFFNIRSKPCNLNRFRCLVYTFRQSCLDMYQKIK